MSSNVQRKSGSKNEDEKETMESHVNDVNKNGQNSGSGVEAGDKAETANEGDTNAEAGHRNKEADENYNDDVKLLPKENTADSGIWHTGAKGQTNEGYSDDVDYKPETKHKVIIGDENDGKGGDNTTPPPAVYIPASDEVVVEFPGKIMLGHYPDKKGNASKKVIDMQPKSSTGIKTRNDMSAFQGNEDDDTDEEEYWKQMTKDEIKKENALVCCSCCVNSKVIPEDSVEANATLRRHFDTTHSMEYAPPEGRKLFFDNDRRRIDYVLVWESKEKESNKEIERDKIRKIFERNLEEEGLELEHDIKEGRDKQYLKIHATYDVLSRYAEVMKFRMPIKEIPEEIQSRSFWELMGNYMNTILSPFAQDPNKIPPMPKKFTHPFERDKEYLFAIPADKELFFSHAQRSLIVDYILRRKKYTEDTEESFSFGIKRLLKNGVYNASYALHEGSWKPWTKPSMRRMLFEYWADWKNWYKMQPLDYVRVYFGEKIGLYFAWLGFYTYALIPPSIVGLICFIYGVATLGSNIVAEETCDQNNTYLMCPLCFLRCPYWNYSTVCREVRATHMFDNGATVFFAIFMALWGTLFLEFWKREQATIQFKWNLMNFEDEEEPPRPEYLMALQNTKHQKKHPITGAMEPYVPFWKKRVPMTLTSISVILFLALLAIAVVIGIIVYRMAILGVLYMQNDPLLYQNASLVTSATAACINLVLIFILNVIYGWMATKLTDWECLRTQSEYESSLTFKLYVLQFVNYYSSLFYIAFFKGRFTGRPGAYNTLFNARQEECQAGGCLIELCIQLAIIFVGKQLIQNNLIEIVLPRVKKFIKSCCYKDDDPSRKKLPPWEKDYILEDLGTKGLFHEYLEMLIQFGFVTIFVAAFPLAPLCALINNIIEIRADANKFVTQLKRPNAVRAQDIGIWFDVMTALSRFSILTNGLIIAFTSGFIGRQVYVNGYSSDKSLNGYVENSLSIFNVSDFEENHRPLDPEGYFNTVETCRYQDYRQPPWSEDKYKYTAQYWHVLAAQFAFVVVFENMVIAITNLVAYVIPDMPKKLKEQVRRETLLTSEIILKTELEIAKGEDGILSVGELIDIRRRARATLNRSSSQSQPAANGGASYTHVTDSPV